MYSKQLKSLKIFKKEIDPNILQLINRRSEGALQHAGIKSDRPCINIGENLTKFLHLFPIRNLSMSRVKLSQKSASGFREDIENEKADFFEKAFRFGWMDISQLSFLNTEDEEEVDLFRQRSKEICDELQREMGKFYSQKDYENSPISFYGNIAKIPELGDELLKIVGNVAKKLHADGEFRSLTSDEKLEWAQLISFRVRENAIEKSFGDYRPWTNLLHFSALMKEKIQAGMKEGIYCLHTYIGLPSALYREKLFININNLYETYKRVLKLYEKIVIEPSQELKDFIVDYLLTYAFDDAIIEYYNNPCKPYELKTYYEVYELQLEPIFESLGNFVTFMKNENLNRAFLLNEEFMDSHFLICMPYIPNNLYSIDELETLRDIELEKINEKLIKLREKLYQEVDKQVNQDELKLIKYNFYIDNLQDIKKIMNKYTGEKIEEYIENESTKIRDSYIYNIAERISQAVGNKEFEDAEVTAIVEYVNQYIFYYLFEPTLITREVLIYCPSYINVDDVSLLFEQSE